MTWDVFTCLFQEQCLGDAIRDLHQTQFENLTQGNMSVLEYENEFDRLVRYVS